MKKTIYKNYEELPLMLSVLEVAEVLGISRAGAYDLVRSKDFPSINIGTRIVIPKTDFVKWINQKLAEKSFGDMSSP